MGTNYKAPIWRMPENANKDKLNNYSIGFDNTNANYIYTSSSWITDLGLNGASRLSVSIWLKPSSSAPTTAMSATSSPYAPWNDNFNIKYDAGNTAMIFTGGNNASNKFYNNSVTLATDQWHHVVFVFTPSGTAAQRTRCWINNSEVANQATNLWLSLPDQGYALYIGRLFYGGGGSTNQWVGEISQFCIFDYSLTDGTGGTTNQIDYLYNLNNPMIPGAVNLTAPVAYWPLGDNSNPNATAGYPNISVGADSVFDFNGATGVIPLPQGSIQVETAITISAWIKTTTTGTRQEILGNDNVSSTSNDIGRCWALRVNGQNIVFVVRQENGGTATGPFAAITTSGVNVGDDNWHHVVALWDGTTTTNAVKVFVDGILRGQTTSSFTQPIRHYALNTPTIGDAAGQTQFWDFEGEMSNIQIWEAGLTYGTASSLGDTAEGEVSQLYNNGQPSMTGTQPQAANLKGWWKLNQSANWEADSTGNWQIPDNRSAYPQSFIFKQNEIIRTPNNVFDGIVTGSNKIGICTISYWLKNKNTGAQQDYMSLNDAGPGLTNSAYFRIDSNNKILYHNGSNYMRWPAPPDLDGWNHYCWVFNSATSYQGTAGQTNGNLQFYLNGEVKAVDYDFSAAPAGEPWNGFNIAEAGQASDSSLDFCMSNLMLYNTNFDSAKVLQLYNNGVPLTTAIEPNNLVTWLKLDNTAVWYANSGQWGIPNAGSTNTQIINFSN